ncbi:DUF3558 domain-containing protein [Nocardia terpenica]|uniref:DUF3558 domain-containing protein n=1 Tax=Nocardia terpenica TaxID=455432 RepID=UPI0018935FD8|nr:DUF3558 domain-containing protein [Nocardia terpenica]MBF6062821.1 DUF3558 domain-containing protein [Nocardia terpenica]MBF6105044.1 DUF3558 domain-containing protein [Nocardia terpenica]MBF6112519.1 DUF3558 domain-containing protein [Nocardia terpenica]MBF6118772.1 DUF3558 domain-containing protein [Nocardia terpenica]MBF6154241.1 DUF3558 domain-containing protein [Nocardia terpenica]
MMLRRFNYLAVGLATAGFVTACSTGTSPTTTQTSGDTSTAGSATSAARPTLTDPKLQPPSQDNEYTKDSARPKVVFDPCTWISDGDLQRAGFDPATRKRAHDIVAEYTFLTCHIDSARRLASLESGNISLDEDKQKYAGKNIQALTINGRDAVLLQKSGDTCSVDMRTKAGYFGISVLLTSKGEETLKPCDGIVDIANILETSIGKDN